MRRVTITITTTLNHNLNHPRSARNQKVSQKCPRDTICQWGPQKSKKSAKTAPLAGRFQTDPTKVSTWTLFWTQFGLQSVQLSCVPHACSCARVLDVLELGWHINLCIFEVHVLHTSGGPGAGASGHCQRSASVGALRSPFILSFVVFPTLHPPREPSGGLVLEIQSCDHHDLSV